MKHSSISSFRAPKTSECMRLGVRSRGFSCHKMASTTAQAVKRLRPTQASLCCKRFELQLAAVKCPQKYNFLIYLLRKWKPRPPKLKTSCFCFVFLFCSAMSHVSINVIISDCFFSESPHHGTNTAWVPPRLGATTRWPWVRKRRESTRDYTEELREIQR